MALTNLNAAPAWTQQSVNSALNGRLHIGAVLPSAAAVTGLTGWRDGVVATTNFNGTSNIPSDLQIKQAVSPSLNLLCEPGHCVITRSGQGPYLCYLSTQGTLTLANADTVNPRIDLIVAQVYDAALGDGMPTTPALASPGGLVIRAVTGTPAGSPTAPSVPTGSIPLAQVAVAANATTITTANITDRRKSALTPGGARTLLPGDLVTDAGAVSGEQRFTNNCAWVWNGTGWVPPGPPVFTSTADRDAKIPSPTVGMQAITSDTQSLWTYRGSSWMRAIGGTFKSSSAQALATGANKIQFPTTVSNSGITVITNDGFQVPYDGAYTITFSARVPSQEFYVGVGGVAYSDPDNYTQQQQTGTSGTTSIRTFLTSGTIVCAYVYINGGATSLAHATRPARFDIWT
jgi:hypothetical protein